MRILFDHGTPAPLRAHLSEHDVRMAVEMGWAEFRNGELLREADERFDILITTDQNLRHEQNLTNRRIAIVVLMTTAWPVIRSNVALISAAIAGLKPGDYREIRFPR